MARVRLPAAPLARRIALGIGAVGAIVLVTQVVLPSGGISGRGVPIAIDLEGLIAGFVDALIAAGLVLIFRTNRILNFTALLLGVPGGLLAFEMLRFAHADFVLSTLVALVVGGGLGALVDIVFGRRFARTSRLLYTVATIFIGGVLTSVIEVALLALPVLPPASERPLSVFGAPNALTAYLPLPGMSFHVGSFPVPFGFGDVFTVEASIVALFGIGAVLRFTRAGVALRSVAQNPDRAATLGVSAGAVSTLAWTLAGLLAALAVLGNGFTGNAGVALSSTASLQALLLPAAAAVLARFRSIPLAAAWSVGLSVLGTAIGFAVTDPNPYLYGGELVIIVAGLLLQRRELYRLAGTDSWRLAAEQKPLPRELAALPGVRVTRYLGAAVLVLVAVGLPVVVGAGTLSQLQSILLTGILGLSLVVLTGWGGQASFGQYAFAAVGGVVAGGATARGGVPFLLAVLLGALVAAACAFVVGLPALRVRGLFLGVATYAFASAVAVLLFDPKLFGWLLPTAIPRPRVFVSFDGETPFYYLCLAALLATVAVVYSLRRSRFGRVLIACRDNDAALQAAGVPVVRTRLVAFAVSGALAGFGGALLAFQLRTVTSSAFSADTSLLLFVYVVVGGVSSVSGALLGVALLGVQNYFLGSSPLVHYVADVFPVYVLFAAPTGLLPVLSRLRDGVLRIIAARRQLVVPALLRDTDAAALDGGLVPLGPPLPTAGLGALPVGARYTGVSTLHGSAGAAAERGGGEGDLFAAALASATSQDGTSLDRGNPDRAHQDRDRASERSRA